MQRTSLSNHSKSGVWSIGLSSATTVTQFTLANDCDLLSSNINLVSSKMTLLVSCQDRKDFRDLLGAVILQMITRSRVTSTGMTEVAP